MSPFSAARRSGGIGEECEANSPSNLPSKVTPLARRSSAPAKVSAEFFAGEREADDRAGREAIVESRRAAPRCLRKGHDGPTTAMSPVVRLLPP